MCTASLSDVPTETLEKIYTFLPFRTIPWCKRTLLISRQQYIQTRAYIAFRSSLVLTNDESVSNARQFTESFDLSCATAGMALRQLGRLLEAYHCDLHQLNSLDPYRNPLMHATIEILLKCQRMDRKDLITCLSHDSTKIPVAAIDTSTHVGKELVRARIQDDDDNAACKLGAQLMSTSLSRHDDASALAVLDMDVFARYQRRVNICAFQAFYLGRVSAFRQVIQDGRLDYEELERYCSHLRSVHMPIGSCELFIYCVENAVFERNIWDYAGIWNQLPEIATYVAAHLDRVPTPLLSQVRHMMRLAIGRLAPHIVAQVLVDLNIDLEDLWAVELETDIVRCPHIVEEVESQVWAYLLAGGRSFTRRRLNELLLRVQTYHSLSVNTDHPGDRLRLLIAEIDTKHRMHYRKPGGRAAFKETEMWWKTSDRVDVDYY